MNQPAAPAPHVPVMLQPMVELLGVREGGRYMDLTFGRGGYARAILERLGAGELIVCDRDPEAVALAQEWARTDQRLQPIRANFAELNEARSALEESFDGVVADLGVSSPQLDQAERGFSFLRDGPLDMRMDPDAGVPASEWLAEVAPGDLMRVLRRYGEEPQARRIALAIIRARDAGPLNSTLQLAAVIEKAVGGRRGKRIHPATRSFQALRMAVNAELESVELMLKALPAWLKPGGMAVIVSFHSLEDRLVKRALRDGARPQSPHPALPPPQPIWSEIGRELCSEIEAQRNPRSRSAVLRWGRRWVEP